MLFYGVAIHAPFPRHDLGRPDLVVRLKEQRFGGDVPRREAAVPHLEGHVRVSILLEWENGGLAFQVEVVAKSDNMSTLYCVVYSLFMKICKLNVQIQAAFTHGNPLPSSLWQLHDFVHLGRLPENVVVTIDGRNILRVIPEVRYLLFQFRKNGCTDILDG